MSSGDGLAGLEELCVFDHGAVDDVGESPFEGADGFAFGVAGVETSGYERLRVGMVSGLGDGDPM